MATAWQAGLRLSSHFAGSPFNSSELATCEGI
jgi:hypothetical protein